MNLEDLLKPVADDKPSGEDFTYHDSFLDLERAAKGKAADQFSEGEEPDWKEVRDKAEEVLRQSKHLRAAVLLTLSLTRLENAAGLRDGLGLVRGLTENFWPDLYPKLDPDDNNDPTERLNTLNDLSSGKFGAHVRQIVLCQSRALGTITLDHYLAAIDTDKPQADAAKPKKTGPDLNQIHAAFRDVGPDAMKVTLASAEAALGHAEAIEKFIDDKLGAGNGVNFESLDKILKDMKKAVEPFAASDGDGAAAEAGDAGTSEAADNGGGGGGGPRRRSAGGGPGTIESGDDVIRAIDAICAYYTLNEPSSPVPLILNRAKKLVNKDFTAIMENLTPEAITQLQVITGPKEDK
jgi:type VI secretion system protein ImpA